MTIDASHLLVFQVNDVKWLYDRFGTAAVRTGLADAITAMDAHAGGLLGRHQAVPVPPSAMPTRWWRGFTMTGAGSALVDVCEQAEALAAAASATGHKVLLDVFGPATGGRLSFEGAVIPLPAPLPADIDAWLEQNWQKDSSRRAELAPDAAAQLRAVIAGQKLRTLLQPIVSLPSGQVVGYEALSRGPEGSALETANSLFGAGERFNLTVELELACARQAAALATALPAGRWLSINLGLDGLFYTRLGGSPGAAGHRDRDHRAPAARPGASLCPLLCEGARGWGPGWRWTIPAAASPIWRRPGRSAPTSPSCASP